MAKNNKKPKEEELADLQVSAHCPHCAPPKPAREGEPSGVIVVNDQHRISFWRKRYERLLKQTESMLVKTLELRDPYTFGHCQRVMELSLLIGKGAGLSEQEMNILKYSALFHDVGKIGVQDCVLLKNGRLSDDEQIEMQKHPAMSAEIINIVDEFRSAVPGVRHHHERYDGKGYPDALREKEIPWTSRIILVADTFDAMTSDRPYRKALDNKTAYDELLRFSGIQFDPEFVKIFLEQHQALFEETKEKERA